MQKNLMEAPVALIRIDKTDRIAEANLAARQWGLLPGETFTDALPELEEPFFESHRYQANAKIYQIKTTLAEKQCRATVIGDDGHELDVWLTDLTEQLATGEQMKSLKNPAQIRLRQINQLAVTALGYAELLDVIMSDSESLSPDKLNTVRHYQGEVSRNLKGMQRVVSGESERRGSGTVLVADGHPALAELIEELLRAEGYRVVSFTDAVSALKYCQVNEHAIGKAVVDENLVDESSTPLIDVLADLAPHIGIVALTNDENTTDGSVRKPVDFQLLLDTLNSASPPPGKA